MLRISYHKLLLVDQGWHFLPKTNQLIVLVWFPVPYTRYIMTGSYNEWKYAGRNQRKLQTSISSTYKYGRNTYLLEESQPSGPMINKPNCLFDELIIYLPIFL